MGRADRDKQIQELHELFAGMNLAILADYRGLTVDDLTQFRSKLRDVDARFRVVKNTLSIRAADGTPLEAVKEHFVGPVGILYSSEDPVGPAKALVDFVKGNDKLEPKLGLLAGKVIDMDSIKQLADLPDRETMLATMLSSLQAPVSSFVRTMAEIPGSFVRVLDAIRSQKDAA